MLKTVTPETKKKPSIRFCPKLRQHEAGIDFVQSNGIKTKISPMGYVAISIEDEEKILGMISSDAFCGITTWENREMPAEQKMSESKARVLTAENDALKDEMAALKEEMAQLKAAKKG